MRLLVKDKVTFKFSSRTITDEGFVAAPARVARSGIQQYLAGELGLSDRKPTDIVNVYRPPEEVFNVDSLATYQFKEITDDHPEEMVSADNVRKFSVGQVVSVGSQDGDYVKVDLLIKDKSAIEKVNSGKTELSAGYYADYIAESGTTDSGQEYEFVQRNIAVNHVALVEVARAGPGAKIFDTKTGGRMAKVTLDNGRSVEIEDTTAALVEDSMERLTKQAKDAKTEVEAKDAELQKEKARADSLDEDNKKLQEASSDAVINAKVADALAIHAVAKKLHSSIEIGDKSIDAIKLEVCQALHPERDFKDKDVAYINATWDMDKEKMEKESEDEEEEKKKSEDSLKSFAKDAANLSSKDAQIVRDNNYQTFLDRRYGKKED